MSALAVDYAQARAHARLGQRPDAGAWRRLDEVSGFGPLIEATRTSALSPWVRRLDSDSDHRDVERAFRAELEARIEEVATWAPERWRAAVGWVRWLVDLSSLAAGGDDGAPARLVGSREPLAEWQRGFSDLLDRAASRSERREIDALSDVVLGHLGAMAAAPVDHDGWRSRRALEGALMHLLRAASARPVALFAYLALIALDAERLRGMLLRRRLFTSPAEVPPWD